MHARNRHEASERDRADPVLDALAGGLRDRGWKADVEPARTEADGQRGEEVPGLVHEDEEREAEDRDEETHAVANLPCARRLACMSASISCIEVSGRRTVERAERVLDERRDVEEADPTVEERRHGDFVRRVERARIRAATLARLARQPEERESLVIRGLELELEARGEVEARQRRRAPLGMRERERDRDAHVRVSQVRERGPVAEADDRVHDRGRMYDDLDRVVVEAEEVVRLDQLEALVRERRGVDRDLRPHGPRGMRERVLHAH